MHIRSIAGAALLFGMFLAIFANPILAGPAAIGVSISVRIAPPILPIYSQPICPAEGYVWIPGYWAYEGSGYYWVPGFWERPPRIGFLWTPGYWGFAGGAYLWHAGYWGPTVGFYGGVNYGFGYPGHGFYGGSWNGNHYFYNTSVTHVNRSVIHNVYNTRVVSVTNRTSYNGGPRGINSRPTAAEVGAAREHHVAMTTGQTRHQEQARAERAHFTPVNNHVAASRTAENRAAAERHNERANRAEAERRAEAKSPARAHSNEANHREANRAAGKPRAETNRAAAKPPQPRPSESRGNHAPSTTKPAQRHTEKPPSSQHNTAHVQPAQHATPKQPAHATPQKHPNAQPAGSRHSSAQSKPEHEKP